MLKIMGKVDGRDFPPDAAAIEALRAAGRTRYTAVEVLKVFNTMNEAYARLKRFAETLIDIQTFFYELPAPDWAKAAGSSSKNYSNFKSPAYAAIGRELQSVITEFQMYCPIIRSQGKGDLFRLRKTLALAQRMRQRADELRVYIDALGLQ